MATPKRIKWEKTNRTTFLSSEDVVVSKSAIYLPSIEKRLSIKDFKKLYSECHSAHRKLRTL